MERLRGFEIRKWFDACGVWTIVVFVCVACCVSEEERLVVKTVDVVIFCVISLTSQSRHLFVDHA